MLPQLIGGLIGFIVASALMPWVISIAKGRSLLDFPDSGRRLHSTPVPRLGGVAIFAATAIAGSFVLGWDAVTSHFAINISPIFPGVILGSVIIFLTGIIDDIHGVKPAFKLIAQTAAALAVCGYGFAITEIGIAGNTIVELGILSVPITVIWMVGMTNAFNLIDGVDGLAASLGLVGLTVAIVVDMQLHQASSLLLSFSLFGAVLGFLRFNRSPARIFLGDSGSMVLGFFLSIRLVVSATRNDGVTLVLVPLFALAYPLLDTFIAITRRWLRGHAFSRADGRHVHHQLLALGLSAARTVDLLLVVFVGIALLGLSITFAPPRVTLTLMTAGGTLIFGVFFYAIRWLRYTEFLELGSSIASVVRNARSHVRTKIVANDIANRLNTAESIEEFTELLNDSASELGLLEVRVVLGKDHYVGPTSRQIWPHGERPYRIDYPITWERDGHTQDAVLRLWCERPDGRRHLGSERIASRLAPAIEGFFKNTPASSAIVDEVRNTGEFRLDLSRDEDGRRSSGKTKSQ